MARRERYLKGLGEHWLSLIVYTGEKGRELKVGKEWGSYNTCLGYLIQS